jgi:CBS domain-containing protein
VWDEASADALVAQVAGLTVADLVEALDLDEGSPTTMVGADATTIEVAAVMSAAHVPLVAVLDAGRFMGVVTVEALVAHLVS